MLAEFQIFALLIGVECCLIIVLIYGPLMACEVEHLFICSFAICIFSMVRCAGACKVASVVFNSFRPYRL